MNRPISLCLRGVVFVVIVTAPMFSRAAAAQTTGESPVGPTEFFSALYAPLVQDVQTNGGPALALRNFGGAFGLNGMLISEIVNLPTSTNAGGLSYSFDPALGVFSRAVHSFGSQFVERADTAGRHHLNVGFAYQRFTFDKLRDRPLAEAGVDAIGVFNSERPPDQHLQVQERASLSRADIGLTTIFLNYGLTSALDVGAFVPIVSFALDASLQYTLRRTSPDLLISRTVQASTRSRVIGMPLIRMKWQAFRRPTGGLAFTADINPEIRAGLGVSGMKFQVVGSGRTRGIGVHTNVGLSSFHCDNLKDVKACSVINGFLISGGIDKALMERLTVSTAVQLQRSSVSLGTQSTTRPVDIAFDLPTNRVTAAVTAKINVWRNLLVTASLLSTSSRGLSDRFTPMTGVDYAW